MFQGSSTGHKNISTGNIVFSSDRCRMYSFKREFKISSRPRIEQKQGNWLGGLKPWINIKSDQQSFSVRNPSGNLTEPEVNNMKCFFERAFSHACEYDDRGICGSPDCKLVWKKGWSP